jgi:hypothetical protein
MRLTDTSPEAEQVLRECYRRMPLEEKLRQMAAIYRTAKLLHAAGVRQRCPSATAADVVADWRTQAFSPALLAQLGEPPVPSNDENLPVLQEVLAAFARLGIPCALGGSWASSLLGKMRFSYDADLTVEPFSGKEAAFVACFDVEHWYISLSAVEEAVRSRSCFNLIHLSSNFKVDVFVRKERPFDQSLMSRRRTIPFPGATVPLPCVTPEDIILLKLEWFRLGDETSERQWTDILGVFEIQGRRLDQNYLDHWGQELGVADLLARARQESGV